MIRNRHKALFRFWLASFAIHSFHAIFMGGGFIRRAIDDAFCWIVSYPGWLDFPYATHLFLVLLTRKEIANNRKKRRQNPLDRNR